MSDDEPMETEKRLAEYAERIGLQPDDVLYIRALLHRAYRDGREAPRYASPVGSKTFRKWMESRPAGETLPDDVMQLVAGFALEVDRANGYTGE